MVFCVIFQILLHFFAVWTSLSSSEVHKVNFNNEHAVDMSGNLYISARSKLECFKCCAQNEHCSSFEFSPSNKVCRQYQSHGLNIDHMRKPTLNYYHVQKGTYVLMKKSKVSRIYKYKICIFYAKCFILFYKSYMCLYITGQYYAFYLLAMLTYKC